MTTWQDAFFEYLQGRGISLLKFAYKFEISPTAVHSWKSTNAYPYLPMRKRIERWSKGAVPADLPNKRIVEAA